MFFRSYEPLCSVGISHWQDDIGGSLFGSAEARLGFVLTVLFICGLFPMAVYTSVLMSRTRTILENLGVKEPLGTMGQAGLGMWEGVIWAGYIRVGSWYCTG